MLMNILFILGFMILMIMLVIPQCEGLTTLTNPIPTGYYKTGDATMDAIPLGCQIDPITHQLAAIPVGVGSVQVPNPACPKVSKTINYSITGPVTILQDISGLLPGYYYTDTTHQTKIPTGCVISTNKRSIYTDPTSKYLNTQCPNWGPTADQYKYDSNNYTQYHDDISTGVDVNFGLRQTVDSAGNPILDSDGIPIMQSSSMSQQPVTFYQPGSYTYGASTYVPNYEDSIYLSKTTGESQVTQLYNTADMQAGFCTQLQASPIAIESACNSIDINQCGSTSCCVLLGGAKCVAGNASGPTNAANYSDVFVQNKDYYYYQGKCYGNCV